MQRSNERGIALITVLLVMMLLSALLVGFTAAVISDQRYRIIDQDHNQTFYAASAGVEKLTADMGDLFFTNVAPTAAQVTALTGLAQTPSITGVRFAAEIAPGILPMGSLSRINCAAPNTVSTVGTNGYTIKFCAAANGNPTPVTPSKPIKSGPYAGLIALQTPYQIDVTARSGTGGDVHLVRTMDAVAIPVFQFGMFSDVDLSFFAGPNFDFGGRVHTNGNLFLSQGNGGSLRLTDRVTAVKEVIRQRLPNGVSIGATHLGTVNVATGPGSVRGMARTEGSVLDGEGSALNGGWPTISKSTYKTWIMNGLTGAKPLNLALLSAGGSNPDLIRRPAAGEATGNTVLFKERLFTKASLRILLSDTAASIASLPGVTGVPPVWLDGDWNVAAALPDNVSGTYGPVSRIDLSHPPIARTAGSGADVTATVRGGSSATDYHVVDTSPFEPVLMIDGLRIRCGSKADLTLAKCALSQAVAPGALITNGAGISAGTSGGSAGNNQTLTITGTATTAFNPTPFWLGDKLVTCTGWTDAPEGFTGCTAEGAPVPANNNILRGATSAGNSIGRIGGYLKIERQDAGGTWTDVTMEILNYGIAGPNQACADPTPNALVRLQRLRDNGDGGCLLASDSAVRDPTQYWPNVLFDAREALLRDTAIAGTSRLALGGVMHYITLDVGNLAQWFAGTGGYTTGTGTLSRTENNGYTVYFSDRRNNRNAAGLETGEYGWEDFVNPGSATGVANTALDEGEDLNDNDLLDTYGSLPNYTDVNGLLSSAPPGAAPPLDGTARPGTLISRGQAQVNRAILFRHALKLTNGEDIRTHISGLTIVSENPVYIQGNWNANPTLRFTGPHAATSIIADAVTLLTKEWKDSVSFQMPYAPNSRPRKAETWYRVAIIAGKGMAFPQPAAADTGFGTDGGAHNFLRHLEDDAFAVNYRGSISTFYYNRQAIGTYKCCDTVYKAPDRNYAFDTDFLNPALLPPNTPLFRDLNAVGFAQEMRPGR